MLSYNASLCVYYACAIALKIQKKVMAKFIEPILLHTLPILFSLVFATSSLRMQVFNPSILCHCGLALYPISCLDDDSPIECIRGSVKSFNYHVMVLKVWGFSNFFLIFVSLGLVIRRAIKDDSMIALESKILRRVYGKSKVEYLKMNRKHVVKAVAIQVIACMVSYTLTIAMPILKLMGILDESERTEILMRLSIPTQGISSLLIFLCEKIYNYRRANPNIGYIKIISLLCCTRNGEAIFFSRMSMIVRNSEKEDNMENSSKANPLSVGMRISGLVSSDNDDGLNLEQMSVQSSIDTTNAINDPRWPNELGLPSSNPVSSLLGVEYDSEISSKNVPVSQLSQKVELIPDSMPALEEKRKYYTGNFHV
jgi:hypothetical protein